MNFSSRRLLPLVLGVMILVSGCSIGGCGADKKSNTSNEPVIGVVNMETAVTKNPAYDEYKQLKDEYENLQSQYNAEQESLTTKAKAQSLTLNGLGTDSDSQAVIDSLNTELKAKKAAKAQELNANYQAKRMELINKYRNEMKVAPTEADLRIVNLQLELNSKLNSVPMTKEMREQADADRAAKEAELKKLLAERGPAVKGNNDELEAKVSAELQPIYEAGKKELDDYEANLYKELSAQRDSNLLSRKQDILDKNNLPDPVVWNKEWKDKLDSKKEEVDAMHDAILEDIRSRVAVVAEEKHVDLVIADYVGNVNALDLTDDIVQSYSDQ